LIRADSDVIAGGLLLDLKTSVRSGSVSRALVFQLVRYPLLDLDGTFGIREVATFSARYSRLTIWDLRELVSELAGRGFPVADLRREWASGRCGWPRREVFGDGRVQPRRMGSPSVVVAVICAWTPSASR
jgi:hypothetical protein